MAPATSGRRIVSVRYRICVYADVDLDTGEVVQVIEDDESARLDVPGAEPSTSRSVALEVVEPAYRGDGKPNRVRITPQLARRAVAAAEAAVWPAWERA